MDKTFAGVNPNNNTDYERQKPKKKHNEMSTTQITIDTVIATIPNPTVEKTFIFNQSYLIWQPPCSQPTK